MKRKSLDWSLVIRLATELGVCRSTRDVWKHRGTVPHHQRIALIKASKGLLSFDSFDDTKKRA